MRLALVITLKFYTSVAKGLKLKVRKFWGAVYYVCRSYRGKTGTPTPHLHPTPIMNRVKKVVLKNFADLTENLPG